MNIKLLVISVIICILIVSLLLLYKHYDKIPSKKDHINRNKYNVFPVGNLTQIKNDKYIDYNNIYWIKRGFFTSLLHNPSEKYVFETYDLNKVSSSEVEILKKDFDNDIQNFKPASFNYYSSFNSPLSHFFADFLPIIIYLSPKYNIYN